MISSWPVHRSERFAPASCAGSGLESTTAPDALLFRTHRGRRCGNRGRAEPAVAKFTENE